ncbi:IS91 family transposase [soil metagenome]
MRAGLEVADIFRAASPAYRAAHAGHLSLHQLKVMSAIEHCRTAVMGGHVEACTDCGHWRVAYNSCRNRHCPRCQGAAARAWLAEREADLLPVGYFHVVFTLPAEVADIAFHNKALVYDLLFKAASETMLTIAADPKHLGARIGITAVLHTWGSALTHHPHVHMIVPGGGIARDGKRWISSRPAFLLPVKVLGKLFRRLFLTRLMTLHEAGRLAFFGSLAHLADRRAFLRHLSPVRKKNWIVYAKPPFAGPEAVLAYLSRYTHRVAISNSRMISFDHTGVTFRYKNYRRDGADRQQVMTLPTDEFIRRFLLHVLPRGFHRIRHYGLLAGATRNAHLEHARQLLGVATPPDCQPARDVDPRSAPNIGSDAVLVITVISRRSAGPREGRVFRGRTSDA